MYCDSELEFLIQRNKQLITVKYRAPKHLTVSPIKALASSWQQERNLNHLFFWNTLNRKLLLFPDVDIVTQDKIFSLFSENLLFLKAVVNYVS